MRYEDIADCGRGTLVQFRDGRQGRLTHWYAGSGTVGVTVGLGTALQPSMPASELPLVDVEPERFDLVEGVLVER